MLKTERVELRRVIRQRMKILRADVKSREAELLEELNAALDERFAAEFKRYEDAQYLVEQARDKCNREVNDIWRAHFGNDVWGTKSDKALVLIQPVGCPVNRQKGQARYDGQAQIQRRVLAALAEIERRECALLEELAADAMETDDAKSFLARIPTVGELVPAARMAAIAGEAQ